jgi:hypothetical protein
VLLVANPEQLVTWLEKIERQGPDADSEQETMRDAMSVFQTRTTRVHGLAWAMLYRRGLVSATTHCAGDLSRNRGGSTLLVSRYTGRVVST